LHTHVPPVHVRSVAHALPHDPQFAPSVLVSTQRPPQSISPVPHAHEPLRQIRPPMHALPHDPQLLASLLVSTQLVMPPAVQFIRGAAHPAWQLPATQLSLERHA
jgi:hypothetical protein